VPAASTSDVTAIAPVRAGVFFAQAEALPRGRHNLTREQVRGAQHERLLAAATELLAARGYRGFGAADIARRAGVSLAAFYDCFDNKDDCVFAGYDRFIDVLLRRMGAVATDGLDRATLVHTLLREYLGTLQSDLVVARAYQVEIDALGPSARQRRRDSLTLFARFVQQIIAQGSPGGVLPPELPWSAFIGVVYAARQLAADALDTATVPDLLALGDDLQHWVADVFRER